MHLDTLPPSLRLNLRDAFDRLADLLDEETERLPRADADELALYAEAKRRLFEQLAILLREANDPALSLHLVTDETPAAAPAVGTAGRITPGPTALAPASTVSGGTPAPALAGTTSASAAPGGSVPASGTVPGGPLSLDGEAGEADDAGTSDPAAPELLRAAAHRLRDRVEVNRRGLLAAQDAVAAVARHVGRAVEQQQTDGVYARAGSLRPRSQPGFGRVEHEL